MNWNVTIWPSAKADLRHAHDWYEERCAGLSDEFLADHAEAFQRLESDPDAFRFTTVVSAASSRIASLIKYFSASSVGTSSSFAFYTVRKTTRVNSADEILPLK